MAASLGASKDKLTDESYAALEPANGIAGSGFKNDPADPGSMRNAELNIRGKTNEYGAFYNARTGEPIIFKTDGEKSSIYFDDEDVRAIRALGGDAIFTHNHPSNSSFSINDLVTMMGMNIGEVRAVSERFAYSISDPSGKFRSGFNLKTERFKKGYSKSALEKFEQSIYNSMTPSDASKMIDEAQAASEKNGTEFNYEFNIVQSHYRNEKMAEKFGLVYKRTPLIKAT